MTRGPMTEEQKRKISASQIARHAKRRATQAGPTHKRCSQCNVVKPVADFNTLTRTLRNGERVKYPSAACKECLAAKKRTRRENFTPEQHAAQLEAQRRWNERRDKEERRRYQREYERKRRRKAGVPERGPWRVFRDEDDAADGHHVCELDYMLLPLPAGLTAQQEQHSHAPDA